MKTPPLSLDALRALLPIVGAVVVIVTGVLAGVEVMLLVLAFFALLGVIALLWASVQSLTGQSPLTLDEALTLAAPSAEEEQKRAVLRALKDIEYELSVGKISPEDHAEFSARYRAEAKRLMQRLDEGEKPAAEQIQALVEQRLAEREAEAKAKRAAEKAKVAAESDESDEDEPEADARDEDEREHAVRPEPEDDDRDEDTPRDDRDEDDDAPSSESDAPDSAPAKRVKESES